jgi:hypothetical protein
MVRIVENKDCSWTVYVPAKHVAAFDLILQEGEMGMLEQAVDIACEAMENWEGFQYEKR